MSGRRSFLVLCAATFVLAVTSGGAGAQDVVALPDGRTLAVGSAYAKGVHAFALAMLKPNGNLDKSFGGDGKVTTTFPNFPAFGYR